MKKIYYKAILIFSIAFYYSGISAQNLVVNPSFEDVNVGSLQCSWYLSIATFNAAINNWTVPTDGTTDIFHSSLAVSCFSNPLSTNGSAVGQQSPHTGSCMTAICTYGNGGCTPWREYVQGRLSSALVPGQQYCVEFYVSLADNSIYATNNIGVYFTTSAWVSTNGGCPYYVTPQVSYMSPIITNKTAWTLISLNFTPTQAYTYFTIGNFYNDGSTTAVNVGGTNATNRYFIDDVDIHLCNPTTVTVNSPAICNGQSAVLNASSNTPGTTFTWSTGGSGSSITVSPTTTTTYTVTGTTPTGSTASAVATVTVNPNPSVSASAAPGSVCNGQCTNLTAAGASTYTWMPGSLTGTTVNVCPGTTTIYTVTGVSAAGCSGTSTVTVALNPSPVVGASASPAAICTGQSSTLTASGASSYSWMPGTLAGTSVNVSPSSTTVYTVTGTSAAGCSSTASVTVTVNTAPSVSASASPTAICNGQCTNLTANGASTYTWMPGSLSGGTVNVCPAGTTIYTVTGTNAAGCTANSTVIVTINPNPTISATASPAAVCPGQCTNLTATGASAYSWMPGTLAGTTVNVCPTATTVYTVMGLSAAGCSGTSTVTVTVNPIPVVGATASPAAICTGQSSTLTGSGASAYSWMPGNLTGTSVNVSPTSTTVYTVTGTSAAGCSSTASVTVTVSAAPSVTAFASPAAICAGQCTNLTGNGASTYSWMPGGLSGVTVNVCPTGTTTYTVTGAITAGCTASATVTVTVNPNPVISAIASPAAVCPGQCTNLTANGASAYSWMPGTLAGTTVNVCPTATTVYTVTGLSAAGCSGTSTVTVTVNPIPVVGATASPAAICEGQSSTLTGSGASTYSWMPGNSTGTSVNVSPTSTTVYTVTGTSVAGCSSMASVTVTLNQNPVVAATAMPAVICPGACTDLSATGALTYLWMPGNLSGSTVNVCPNINTLYTVTGTSAQGCTATGTVSVTIASLPVVSANASAANICVGGCTDITASGADTYSWLPGGLTGTSVNVCPVVTTIYTVTGTSTDGCTDTEIVTVSVTPIPVITTYATNDTLCFGQSTGLSAGGANNFQWQPGGMPGSSINVTPDATTTYTVTGDVNGCTASGSITVNVYPYPVISFSADKMAGCEDLLVQFTDLSNFNDATWYWEFGDNTFSYLKDPLHLFTEPGIYDVSLTMTTIYGCTSSFNWQDMITVYKLPEAEFVFVPESATELEPTVWFYDRSIGASAWEWNFGDFLSLDNNSNLQNPIHIYADTGIFNVMLVVMADNGCPDTAWHSLYVAPNVAVFVPNAFTPNDDLQNPNFICKGEGIDWSTFEMRIYDRWGKQLLFTNDHETGWDGKYNGVEMPQDVYTWLISFIDIRLKKHNLKGIVTLVK
ncbi:MAG TPA: PKD domain-containing protein [Bacteroidales bacterium]|nr:PKD domain-containing protein [Bacteroidales bacterium]